MRRAAEAVGSTLGNLRAEIDRLTAENEALRKHNEELQGYNVGFADESLRLQQERDQLKAYCERLRIAALNAISIMPSGGAKADLRDAYDETPEQSLAAHNAEVIEKMLNEYSKNIGPIGYGGGALVRFAESYANQLRQQAKES